MSKKTWACPECGHENISHNEENFSISNYIGKICIGCGFFLPSISEMPIIKMNREKLTADQNKVIEYLKKKNIM